MEYTSSNILESISDSPRENLSLNYCVFRNVSSPTDGGAIFLDNYKYLLSIKNCGFSVCSAQSTGGAVYLEGAKSTIQASCFYGCNAQERDQAVHSDTHDMVADQQLIAPNEFTLCHVCQCSQATHRGKHRAVLVAGGHQSFDFDNFTNNHVVEEGACFNSRYVDSFSCKGCTFSLCSGASLIHMHKVKREDPIEHCNVIANTLSGAASVFSFIYIDHCNCQLTGWTFIDNHASRILDGTQTSEMRMINCQFDRPQTGAVMFGAVSLATIDTKFNVRALSPRTLSIQPTWHCWALGEPSPSASKKYEAIPNENAQELSGKTIVLIFLGVMVSLGILGYFFWTFFQAPDEGQLSRIEIRN